MALLLLSACLVSYELDNEFPLDFVQDIHGMERLIFLGKIQEENGSRFALTGLIIVRIYRQGDFTL